MYLSVSPMAWPDIGLCNKSNGVTVSKPHTRLTFCAAVLHTSQPIHWCRSAVSAIPADFSAGLWAYIICTTHAHTFRKPEFTLVTPPPLDFINLFPSHLLWQLHVNKIIPLFDSRRLETHCFYIYCLWLQSHLGSMCFWIIPRVHIEKLETLPAHIASRVLFSAESTQFVCVCLSACV